jgi:outer membrane lipopolysaccharide assembly protein LptE/RlpB
MAAMTGPGLARAVRACALLPVLFALSCNYHLVKEQSASLPSGIQSLSIPLAQNQTIEAGLEDVFTQEMIKRLSADGRFTILSSGAEAELRCVLSDITVAPVSYTREGRVAAESVGIEARCSLVAPRSESLVWNSGILSSSEEYPVGDNYLANEDAKARAILEICRDLAESMRQRLLDSF